jgi:heat shock protein HslJ
MRAPALVFLVLCVLAGCATREKEPPPKPFIATRWQVMLEIPIPGEPAYVRFGDGQMEGFGGCNKISARFVQDSVGARAIVLGRIVSGRRGCDPGAQASETRMLEVLQSVSSYTITADQMIMTGSAGSLKFKAKPEETKP